MVNNPAPGWSGPRIEPPHFKPAPGPMLPGVLPKPKDKDPTNIKQVAPPKDGLPRI